MKVEREKETDRNIKPERFSRRRHAEKLREIDAPKDKST